MVPDRSLGGDPTGSASESAGLHQAPLEQIDSGDRVVKVLCKVFERPDPRDCSAFQLALAA